MSRVLFDGWTLLRQPTSPAALHLLTLLWYQPREFQAWVALPGEPPEWLPENVHYHVRPVTGGIKERLQWEQRALPKLARELGAGGLHLVTSNPPLFGRTVTLVSPAGIAVSEGPRGFFQRLREALSRGGTERLAGILWPEDLAGIRPPYGRETVFHAPVAIYPGFSESFVGSSTALPALDLPETYILYHGSLEVMILRRLLSAWSWAAGPIGEYYPLLLLGIDQTDRGRARALLTEYDFGETVRLLPPITPKVLPALYRGCSALFHPAPVAAWEGSLRAALALGKPVVSIEDPMVGAIVGSAAYLAPPGDERALGAALITTIVEDRVAESLSQAARQRAENWRPAAMTERLVEVYHSIF